MEKLTQKERHLRILKKFEKELSNYHSHFFNQSDYSIQYIITKKRFNNKSEIVVIINILSKSMWGKFFNTPREFKQIIENYSNYFSIKDFIILRSIKKFKNKNETMVNLQPIEERIQLEYFGEMSMRDFI